MVELYIKKDQTYMKIQLKRSDVREKIVKVLEELDWDRKISSDLYVSDLCEFDCITLL